MRIFGVIFMLGLFSLSGGVVAEETDPSLAIWTDLASIPAGKPLPKKLKKSLEHEVTVAGYIIANEFDSSRLKEFLLTRIPGGCVHVPLPPPSSLIHVVMKDGATAAPLFGKRVQVTGHLTVGERVDAGFEMVGSEVKEFPFH